MSSPSSASSSDGSPPLSPDAVVQPFLFEPDAVVTDAEADDIFNPPPEEPVLVRKTTH
jgi:hypothetical protein